MSNLNDLPASTDEFFDGAEKEAAIIKEVRARPEHHLVWMGAHALCTSCEYPHTVPLDFRKYDLVDGKPAKRIDTVN